jgi:hypothetical protein
VNKIELWEKILNRRSEVTDFKSSIVRKVGNHFSDFDPLKRARLLSLYSATGLYLLLRFIPLGRYGVWGMGYEFRNIYIADMFPWSLFRKGYYPYFLENEYIPSFEYIFIFLLLISCCLAGTMQQRRFSGIYIITGLCIAILSIPYLITIILLLTGFNAGDFIFEINYTSINFLMLLLIVILVNLFISLLLSIIIRNSP